MSHLVLFALLGDSILLATSVVGAVPNPVFHVDVQTTLFALGSLL
jgi:hypothetical protein